MKFGFVRAAGYDDVGLIEIVLNVALNVLTNYINNVAQTDVDFPKVELKRSFSLLLRALTAFWLSVPLTLTGLLKTS